MSEDVKQLCNLYIDETIREVLELGKHISNTCEAAFQEYESCKHLCEFLQNHGFVIERNIGKLPTSFKAQYTKGIGPTIALLAEYDTINSLGVKNQNYFTSICAVACVLGIKKVLEVGEFNGTIQVYGTPAKVVNLGKSIMMEHGVFDKVDAIFIARASDGPTRIAGTSQNSKSYSISFKKYENNAVNATALFEKIFLLLQKEIKNVMPDETLSINVESSKKHCQIEVISKDRKDVLSIEKKIRDTARTVGVISECRVFMESDNNIIGRFQNEILKNVCIHEAEKYNKSISTVIEFEKEKDDLGCVSRMIPTCCLYFNLPLVQQFIEYRHDLLDEDESCLLTTIKVLASTIIILFTNKKCIESAKHELYQRQKEELKYAK